jgi:hypothetical protein
MPNHVLDASFTRSNNPKRRTGLKLLGAFWLFTASLPLLLGGPADVPTVSAGLGPCTADFTVTDASSKPVYNAKIHLKMKYGFMSKRDTELDVATDSNGKARMEGLPIKLKKPPMEFTIRKDAASQTVTADPATNCHSTFAVTLGK